MPELWATANLEERRKLLLTMMDAVYVDAKEERRIVAIGPRPAFRPLLEIATTRESSGIVLVTGKDLENANQPPPDGHEADSNLCPWWRRGRVELPVQKTPRSGYATGLAGDNCLAPTPLYRRRIAQAPAEKSLVLLIGVSRTAPRFMAPIHPPRG